MYFSHRIIRYQSRTHNISIDCTCQSLTYWGNFIFNALIFRVKAQMFSWVLRWSQLTHRIFRHLFASSTNSDNLYLSACSFELETWRRSLSLMLFSNFSAFSRAFVSILFMSRPSASKLWFYNWEKYCNLYYYWHKYIHEQHTKQQLRCSFQQHVPVALHFRRTDRFAAAANLRNLSRGMPIHFAAIFVQIHEQFFQRLAGVYRMWIGRGFVRLNAAPKSIKDGTAELHLFIRKVLWTMLKPKGHKRLNS